MNIRRIHCVFLCMLAAMNAMAAAAPATATASGAMDAILGGKLTFGLRARYEHAEQDGRSGDADAFTNRTLLGWRTLPLHGISVYVEAIDVTRIGGQNYNDTAVASVRHPTVADPENSDVNQMYLDHTGLADTRIRLGRQSLKLDNVRFVGNVEFRQVMQVFTGLWLENRSVRDVQFDYGHFVRVKNIFAALRQTRLDLVRASWTFMPDSQLTGFAYFQDQPVTGQATGFADNSNRILGVRANGVVPLDGPWKLPFTMEIAQQDAYADGNGAIDARYWRAGGGLQHGNAFVRLDREVLGSNDNRYAFQTPLGTNHLFQGWADQFLTTPRQGIRDTFLSAGTVVSGVQLITAFHDFRSDFGNQRLGREWDVGATYVFSRQFTGKLEYARFREGDVLATRFRDTTRIWVTGMLSF